MRLSSIVHFRALAIVLIVAGHSYWIISLATDIWIANFLVNLIVGATSYFVFISGYMFYHVYVDRFVYKSFIIGKVRNVLLPYLCVSVPVTVYFLLRNPILSSDNLSPYPIIEQFFKIILTGSTFPAFWFIPFIMVTFLLSPLHLRFARLGFRDQISILLVSLFIALLVHRPIQNMNVLHSIIYFNPIYLLGIIMSCYRNEALKWFKGLDLYILLFAISIAALQTTLGQIGNSHKAFFDFAWVDFMLVQKLTMAVAIFIILERLSAHKPKFVELISKTSFPIFFLHPIALMLLNKVGLSKLFKVPVLDLLFITTVAILFSILVAITAKTLLGWRSKLVVGY